MYGTKFHLKKILSLLFSTGKSVKFKIRRNKFLPQL